MVALADSTKRGATDAQKGIDCLLEEVRDAMLQTFWNCFMTIIHSFIHSFTRCGDETRLGGALVLVLVLVFSELVNVDKGNEL